MKVVIPLIESTQDNIELRYCLRSIEKHLTGCEAVIIIGYKPNWLTGITYMPYKPATTDEWKEKNIYDKLSLIKGRFLYFNDDHFLLTDFKARNFPHYYSGTLAGKLNSINPRNVYKHTINNTIKLIGKDAKFFGLHCPVILNGIDKPVLDWNKHYGYCLRSIYTVELATEIVDLKLTANFDKQQIYKLLQGREFFSTNESAMNATMLEVMQELYPEKSKYEI